MAVSMKDLDPVFQGIGSKIGTEVWNIKNFRPMPIAKIDHGKFYSGQAYVILQTCALKSGVLRHDIFYWLGKRISQNEASAAASKAVELDAALGGRAVLSREEEGFETDKFLSYFKPCVLPIQDDAILGGQTEGEYENRLFMCKGRHVIRVKEVPFTRSSLNHDYVFVLNTRSKIFQFNGANTDTHQQAKALDVVKYLKETFHKKECQLAIIEDGKFVADADSGEFWGLFGGFAPLGKKLENDRNYEPEVAAPTLLCVHEGKAEKVEAPALERGLLSTNKCYILDCGRELFTWVGRDTILEERKAATVSAEECIAKRKNDDGVHLTGTIEGFEPREFRSKFEFWPITTAVAMSEDGRGKVAVLLKHKGFNVKGLLKAAPVKKEQSPPLNMAGKLKVWCINGNLTDPLPSSEYGKFYNNNCYVILYSYLEDQREEHLVFSWFGHQSTAGMRDSTSQFASEVASSFQESIAEVHIFEGKEPPHFLSLFDNLLILKGDKNDTRTRLLEVKKSGPQSWQAIQVDLDALSLNSSGCFFLQVDDCFFTWYGKFSTVEEQEATEAILQVYKPGTPSTALKEGSEFEAFWDALGGRKVHASHREPKETGKDPHLFSCSFEQGKLKVMEIFNFTQENLLNDEIMILDCGNEIFVWVGQAVSPKLKSKAWDIGQNYIEEAARYDGISIETPLYKLNDGGEPSLFKAYFTWDSSPVMQHLSTFQRKALSLKGQSTPVSRSRRRASLDGGGRLPSFTSSQTADLVRARRSPTFRSADPSPERIRLPPSSARTGAGPKHSLGSSVSALSSLFEFSSPTNGGEVPLATPVLKLASLRTSSTKKKELAGSPSAPASIAPSPRTPRPVASPRSPAIAALASVFESYSDKRHDFAWPGVKPRSDEKTYTKEVEARKTASVTKDNGDQKPLLPKVTESATEEVQLTYPYERLKVSSPDPVAAIDSSKRETYLSKQDFQDTFRMDRETFYKLPKWKQDKYKILADLF